MQSERSGQSESGGRLPLERRSELLTEALSLLRVPDDRKENARAWVKVVAENFKRNRSEQRSAPRLADIKRRLPKAVRQARELADFLGDFPYLVRVASGYDLLDIMADLEDERGRPKHPKILRLLESDARGLPRDLGAMLLEFADLTEPLVERWPADTGHERDLFAMFTGSPKEVLAVECWELFDWFRPGEATGTVPGRVGRSAGDYHRLMETVYELATGKEADEDRAGLERYTKKVAKFCRQYSARNPNFERVRRALALGQSPVGLIGSTEAWARFVGNGKTTRLYDRIMGAGSPEE